MDVRAEKLYTKANRQIGTLIEVLSDLGDADLRRPCLGREKLGDGSVGTVVAHTADNYGRIAVFLASAGDSAEPPPSHPAGHHLPHAAERIGSDELRDRLSAARRDLVRIAELDDRRLDSIPPEGGLRFCDGNRSLEEVLSALLTHQGHQVEALARSRRSADRADSPP